LARNGRVYTIRASDVPRGRGDGQVLRIMVEIPNETEVWKMFVADQAGKYFTASSAGYGFIVPGSELGASKKAGKPIMVLQPNETWEFCEPLHGDHVAIIGTNRKLLIFPLTQMAEYPKGKGVVLQKYKAGKLSDLKLFALVDGLTWTAGEKTRIEKNLDSWVKARAAQGQLPPPGFPKNNRF
jgi:topoisomerase IV subunit A